MRAFRNSLYFVLGFFAIALIAIVPEAYAEPLTTSAYEQGIAETQQILTGIAHSLMFALGIVAGRFR